MPKHAFTGRCIERTSRRVGVLQVLLAAYYSPIVLVLSKKAFSSPGGLLPLHRPLAAADQLRQRSRSDRVAGGLDLRAHDHTQRLSPARPGDRLAAGPGGGPPGRYASCIPTGESTKLEKLLLVFSVSLFEL